MAHRLIVRERAPTISPMLGPSGDEAMRSTQLRGVIQGVGEIAAAIKSILSDEVGQYLISHWRSRSSSYASSLGDLYSATGIPSVASLEGLTGVLARDTMIGLAEDLLDTYRFVSEHLGIPISDVQDRVHGSTRTHPQPYSSHRFGSGHGGSAHDDPSTDHSFSLERHIHTIDPSASVTV